MKKRAVRLEEVVEIHDRLRVPLNSQERAERPGSFPYYGANGRVDTVDGYIFDGTFILLAEDGGHFFDPRPVAYEATGKFWVNNHAHVLAAKPGYDHRYLIHALNAVDWSSYVGGTTRLKLTQTQMKNVSLVLPECIEEQRRLASYLDDCLVRSERIFNQLDQVPVLIEKFRQSVLAAAFRGDLTKEWREQNPDVEPASVLLQRIRAERRESWIAAETEKARAKAEAKAKKTGKRWTDADNKKVLAAERPKVAKKYVEPKPIDPTDLPELPPTWCWAQMEELTPGDAPIVYGIIQPGPHIPNGVPYVRPVDISNSQIEFSNLPRTTRDIAARYERASLKEGDLVYSVVGTIGKWIITPSVLEGANITQSSVRIRPVPGLSVLRYLRALQSPQVEAQIQRLVFGNAVQRLNVGHVRELVIPLIPADEWDELEVKVERSMAIVLSLGVSLNGTLNKVSQLERSILASAFQLGEDSVFRLG